MRKVLEGANIKLGSVAADIHGKSARRGAEVILAGTGIDMSRFPSAAHLRSRRLPG